MAIELITGHAGEAHISSADDGAYNAGTDGGGRYILQTANQMAASMPDANTVTIATGDALFDGRHVRISAPESIGIDSGTQGMQRRDIVGIEYGVAGGIESASLAVVKGTPAASATDPALPTGSILEGASSAFMPLYRIPISGVSVGTPVLLASKLPLLSDTASAAALNQAQTSLNSDITTNRNNIATNTAAISALRTRATNLETRATNLEKTATYNHIIIAILGDTNVNLYLRRQGHFVTASVDGAFTPTTANTALACGTIPSGYRPATNVKVTGNGFAGGNFTTTTPYFWTIGTNGAVTFCAKTKTLLEYPLTVTYFTSNAWPS